MIGRALVLARLGRKAEAERMAAAAVALDPVYADSQKLRRGLRLPPLQIADLAKLLSHR
jgi:hypothetical protein